MGLKRVDGAPAQRAKIGGPIPTGCTDVPDDTGGVELGAVEQVRVDGLEGHDLGRSGGVAVELEEGTRSFRLVRGPAATAPDAWSQHDSLEVVGAERAVGPGRRRRLVPRVWLRRFARHQVPASVVRVRQGSVRCF